METTDPLKHLVEGPATGAEQMARDRSMLRAAGQKDSCTPVLRLYSWAPPCLSLGFHQSGQGVRHSELMARGIDFVRRPTGGAAVYHHEEITWSLAGKRGGPFGEGRDEIYAVCSAALAAGLRELGIPVALGGGGRPEGPACFSAAGGHELNVAGRKIMGSALRLSRRGFLIHGSLLVGDAHLDLCDLMEGSPTRTDLAAKTTTLRQLGFGDLKPSALAVVWARHLSAVHCRAKEAH